MKHTTHTFAELQISAAAFAQISAALCAAGYDGAFIQDNRPGRPKRTLIDMEGIAVFSAPASYNDKADEAVDVLLQGCPKQGGGVKRETLEQLIRAAFEGGVAAVKGELPEEIAELPVPKQRFRCIFCDKPLLIAGKFAGLTICTTAGVAILCCPEHAIMGDDFVQVAQLKAKALLQDKQQGN